MLQEHISRYKALDFFARQVVEGFITGRHRSPFHGFSAEFSDYRQYNTGESTRNIDWRLFARTDKLFVKQFQDETNLRCQLVIDRSPSMLFPVEHHGDINHPNKLTFSVYAAAVLIEILHRQRDAFGLTLLDPSATSLSPANYLAHTPCRSSATHQRYLLSLLDPLLQPFKPEPRTPNTERTPASIPLPDSLHLLAEQLHQRSLVVIFTDAFDQANTQEPLFDALRHLRHNRHEVILFHTFDRALELDLAYDARPTRFIDLETGRQVKLQPADIAEHYSRQMHHLQANLQQHALRYNIDYQPVDVALGFHQVLQPFLIHRSKM